jgi:hypothetical protein
VLFITPIARLLTRPDQAAGDDASAVRSTRSRVRTVAGRITTGLAAALVVVALVIPNEISRFTADELLRIPVEGIVGVALFLMLPARPRRIAAVVLGLFLGLLAIVKILDMGFFSVLGRPFNLVLDWILLDDAKSFLTDSIGGAGATGVAIALVVLLAALVALMALAMLRLSRFVVAHRTTASRTAVVLGVVWVISAGLGLSVADHNTAELVKDRAFQVSAGLQDQEKFATESRVDAFAQTPGAELLSGLRGKDVIVTFIESYGRDAVEDPEFAAQVGAVLEDGNRRLGAAGFHSRSAFLTSPTAGGGSWLAHATLLSGLWIDNQQRYTTLVGSDRLTLTSAFQRADWETVGVMPAITRAWPEGTFYGFDRVWDCRNLGYKGPKFSYAPMPDQYTLAQFQRTEMAKPDRGPLMAEIELISSHGPWAPLPVPIDWNAVGDGSVYGPIAAAGEDPNAVLADAGKMRTAYRQSIEYSVGTLISYVETYGNDNLVLVFLGDHQPAPVVTGADASRDVPITIVTRDTAVMDRIASWNWQDGLKPDAEAPVWRMDSFRDRFLSTFSTKPH